MTAQAPDRIYCEDPCPSASSADAIEPLYSNPLTAWLAQHPVDFGPGGSTALWRGYVATWRIRGRRLWLEDVTGKKLTNMFADDPARTVGSDGLVWADWATTELRVPEGKRTRYVHMGYGSQYERDRLICVQDGRVVLYELIDISADKQLSLQVEVETIQEIAPPEYRPFLSDIFREPTSMDRRLVFADWLEEQGDPLAPLLRLIETDEHRRLSEREKAIARYDQLCGVLGCEPVDDWDLLATPTLPAAIPDVTLYERVFAALSAAARKRRNRHAYIEFMKTLPPTQYSLLRSLGLLPSHHLMSRGWNEE